MTLQRYVKGFIYANIFPPLTFFCYLIPNLRQIIFAILKCCFHLNQDV
nr:MAG TPA: hypothetical protein [Crassvirales sp.]